MKQLALAATAILLCRDRRHCRRPRDFAQDAPQMPGNERMPSQRHGRHV